MQTIPRKRMDTVCAAVPNILQRQIYEDATKKGISPSELIRRILTEHYDSEKIVITATGG